MEQPLISHIKSEPEDLEIKSEDMFSVKKEEEFISRSSITDSYGSNLEEDHSFIKTEVLSTDCLKETIVEITKDDICSSDELTDDEFVEEGLEQIENYKSTELNDFNDCNVFYKEEMVDNKTEERIVQNETEVENISNKKNSKSNKKFSCNVCDFKTSIYGSLKKHAFLHEDINKVPLYFCTKCSYRTRQKSHLKRHDLIHQNSSEALRFTCGICDFKTKQKCTLRRHVKSIHIKDFLQSKKKSNDGKNLENELFKCDKCSYKSYKKSLLMSHMDKHKDNGDITNLYICDICSFSTKYRRNLRMHLETHKSPKNLQSYECKLCNFKSRMQKSLRRHLVTRKHLAIVGKLEEYRPRSQRL